MNLNHYISILYDDKFLHFFHTIPPYIADQLILQTHNLPNVFKNLEPKKFDALREVHVTTPDINPPDKDIIYLANFICPDLENISVPIEAEVFIDMPRIAIPESIVDISYSRDGNLELSVKNLTQIIRNNERFDLSGILYGAELGDKDAILRQLEDIINNPNSIEADLQNFLENNPTLLTGSEYQTVFPQACIEPVKRVEDKPWNADFILKPFSQTDFCKIIEIKRPQVPIQLKEASGHRKFSHQLYSAIQQVKDYAEAFNEQHTRAKFKEKYGVDVVYPEMHIIIGRAGHIIDTNSIMEFQNRNNVRIEDWDTFLKKLKAK